MIKIAIIENDEEMQVLLQEVIALDKKLQVKGVFYDGKTAITNIPLLKPDIVMVDIGLPDISGIECIGYLKPLYPWIEYMVCSSFGDEGNVLNALQAGASSYMLKSSSPDFIIQSIYELKNGGSPMSPEIVRILINRFFATPAPVDNSVDKLTRREYEILKLLSTGQLYKEIADQLEISINTLKVHCYKIYQKLHVTNRIEAIRKISPNF